MKACGYYIVTTWNPYAIDIYHGIVVWSENVPSIFKLMI